MNKTLDIFNDHFGYASLRDLKKAGVHTDTIRNLLDDHIIEKIKPGLYKLSDMPMVAHQGFIDVCLAMPKAVICLLSALDYYDLTTFIPSSVMAALPRGAKPTRIIYPPVQIYYFSGDNYSEYIEEIRESTGSFRIYSIEKTVVDCFRYRNKLGEDLAVEGLKNYLELKSKNIPKLYDCAQKGRMWNIIRPYITAVMHQ
ncbi:Abortive infection protein AbiEi [candidate division KSB1 bacterium]|nr:Abortive infection protein AbiEi [candidate division KSB1 bacterium]